MNYSKLIVALITAGTFVTGCASFTPVNKETAGTGIGAATGALLGYGLGKGHSDKEAAIVVGALFGGFAGNRIGARMNEADRVYAGRALSQSLEFDPVGSQSHWRNPQTGHTGYSTPTNTYSRNDGTPCREFTTAVIIGGQRENAHGIACRQSDGSWQLVQR